MKAITKKIILASVAVGVMIPFITIGCNVVHAENISLSTNSNNEIEVTDTNYTINGTTTSYSGELDGLYAGNEGSNNSVTIRGGTIFNVLSGGRYNNVVNIFGGSIGTLSNGVWGGISYISDATGNTINMHDGWAQLLVGGWHSSATGNSGNASNNNVNIYGGTVALYVYGGNAKIGNANYNAVNIYGGTITGGVYGGFSDDGGVANNNTVIINDGIINENDGLPNVVGGISVNGETNEANNNSVIINGGTINTAVIGGMTGMGNSGNNSVTINNGTINGNIGGAFSYESGYVTNNTITINGGIINSDVVAGISEESAMNNSIDIYNSPNLSNTNLYGYFFEESTSITHLDNALNIYTKELTAKNIANFDIINFYLPESTVNGDTILTLSETNTDISGAAVNVGVAGNANLNTGDTVTLLTNAGTITTEGTTYGKLTEGVSLEYDLTVSKDGDNKIIATIGNVSSGGGISDSDSNEGRLIPETEIFTVLPPLILDMPVIPEYEIFEDFDLSADDKKDIGLGDNIEQKGWEIFADVGGGSMKYKGANGSYVDTKSHNIDLGFARNIGNEANKMTIAPIIDYQNTDYDSYLNDGTHGEGTSKYIGGGFVLRNMNHNGFYYEGSFRAGRNKTDFASNDLSTSTVTYDTSSTVLNGHVKLGKYLRLDRNNLLDIYGFYYHTHQGDSGADLSSGEHYNFSSANAGRARIGYRLTTRTSKISQVYTGLAYQFEHNSGVTATYKDYSTSGDSHNGSSGMLEIGWIVKPLKENPWAVNINATGWVGNQRGVKAMAKVQKSF